MEPAPDLIDEVTFLRVGHCRAPERAVRSGGAWCWIEFPATVAVLRHRTHGVILFDTGYAPRYFEILRKLPYAILGPVLGAVLPEKEQLCVQLKRLGIAPEEVRTVIISHFHLDHISGLRDFPRANYLFSAEAWKAVSNTRGWRAFHQVFHPGCIPADFEPRSLQLHKAGAHADSIFPEAWDVFGDQSIVAIGLPGHAPGQFGIRFACQGSDYFLIADACWHQANITAGESPHPLAGLVFDNRRDFWLSLRRLRQFAVASPEVLLLPNHCQRTMEPYFNRA